MYFFYITTNFRRTTYYCGITNALEQRIIEHFLERGKKQSFAGRYYTYFLLYYESYKYVDDAIDREKEVKKWTRAKKEKLIAEENPERKFLNEEIFDRWPPNPKDLFHRKND